MNYTEKFQRLADAARAQIDGIPANEVDSRAEKGAVVLDIRDKEEFDRAHIPRAVHLSRGKLEMHIETLVPNLETEILCYCNANNRGALSAATLRAMGYANAKLVIGGLSAYREAKSDRAPG